MKDEIVLNNIGLIYKVMKDVHCTIKKEDDFEEYYSAGLIGLIKASKTYDKKKSKVNYLYNAIKMEIFNCMTSKNRKLRKPLLDDTSINKEYEGLELQEILRSNVNVENEVLNKIFVEELLNKLKNRQYKRLIIEYYGIGCPSLKLQELAEKYGVSKQAIHQDIKWGLELLRKEIR